LDNISRLKYAIAGQAALTESFYGTRKVSYSGEPTDARLMIKHSKPITEGDKRYRYVESLFIETAEGERFRLPFRKLAGGRAMVEHVRQGGNPYDMRGQHISETVSQLNTLSQFRRAQQGRVYEGSAASLVTETDQYYQRLNHNLKHMANSRGYQRYFESWQPAEISDSDMVVEDLRSMFIETRIDPRIEQALPMLARIQKEVQAMKEAEIFESWASKLIEGTWAVPDTPEQIDDLKMWMSQPRPLGADADDVTEVLYKLIGDDALFDQLQAMAEEDPEADAVPIVQAWIDRNIDHIPELAELSSELKQPAEPVAAPAPVQEPVPAEAPPPDQVAPVAPVAEGEDDLVDIEPALHGLTSEFDKFLKHGDRMERDPAYGNKWRKHYAKIAAKERSRLGGNHPDHEVYPDPDIDEGDNIATFEDTVSPRFAGLQQTQHDDGSKTTDYSMGPLQSTQKVDAQGRPLKTTVNYDMGVGKVGREQDHVSGIQTTTATPADPNADPNTLMPTSAIAAARGVDPNKFADFQAQQQPVKECNYTMENHYCPVHGLAECSDGIYETQLARIKLLSLLK